MAIYVANSFSLNMLSSNFVGQINVQPAGLGRLDQLLMGGCSPVNAIGHADTARLVADLLAADGICLPSAERQNVKLCAGDTLIVAQYNGPRLPEGTMRLPEEANITFLEVSI